jgi:hypothetical protein
MTYLVSGRSIVSDELDVEENTHGNTTDDDDDDDDDDDASRSSGSSGSAGTCCVFLYFSYTRVSHKSFTWVNK